MRTSWNLNFCCLFQRTCWHSPIGSSGIDPLKCADAASVLHVSSSVEVLLFGMVPELDVLKFFPVKKYVKYSTWWGSVNFLCVNSNLWNITWVLEN